MLATVNQADKTNYFKTTTPELSRGYFNASGAFVSSNDYQCLTYFEVDASKEYTSEINLEYGGNGTFYNAIIYQIAAYDADKNFISFLWNDRPNGTYTMTFTTPVNCKYLRFCYARKTLPLYAAYITWYACGLYKGSKSYLSEEI